MNQIATAERTGKDAAWTLGPIIEGDADADAHIDPPHDMWKHYLPAGLRDLAPVIEEGDECDRVKIASVESGVGWFAWLAE